MAQSLEKTYRSRGTPPATVLRGVDFTVHHGERVAVVGPSGSGKSTLLHCLSGLETPTAGKVHLFGEEPSRQSRTWLAKLYRQSVAFVFQQYNLVPALSGYENVVLPARLGRRRVDRLRVMAVLEELGISHRASAIPRQMSGGEQQRFAIARAIVTGPSLLFADEPTGALDTASSRLVMTAMETVVHQGAALVYVTHDPVLAARSDRVVIMHDGSVTNELQRPDAADIADAVTKHGGGVN